jgi:hypothetical protein
MTKKEIQLINILIYCPKLGKNVTIKEGLYWSGYDAHCDICGSHGAVKVSFQCKCGKEHTIELDSW